jgi:RNA polymerase sigma-70 factor (ECF subfamily)
VRSARGDDEASLVAAAKAGDRSAFDELVRRTYRDVYTLAHRLSGNVHDAADITQDVYLRAYRSLGRFRGDSRFSTWLYRIAANCGSTHLTRRRRRRVEELDEDSSPVVDDRPGSDPALRAEASHTLGQIEAAVARLPDRLRSVVVLRDVHELPHREVADALGISESAAKVRLHRARRKLTEYLSTDDDAPRRSAVGGEDEARAV